MITSISSNEVLGKDGGDVPEYGNFLRNFEYNKNGLIKSFSLKYVDINGENITKSSNFKYKNGKVIKKTGDAGRFDTNNYIFNKNNLLVNCKMKKTVITSDGQDFSESKNVKMSYDKSGLIKESVAFSSNDSSNFEESIYKHGNKGEVKTIIVNSMTKDNKMSYQKSKKNYKYDKNGNVAKIRGNSESEIYRLSYDKNNKLVSKENVSTNIFKRGKYTYSYKTVRVPEKYAEEVKKQQWEIINPYFSFYFDVGYEL